MAANTGALAGRTLFITGASRGIGKAIALKAAKDGANVVIAAKTADPHPKLPGTIYTAAEEINKAGGQAHPCIVDVRNEDQVQQAVEEAAKRFGGIDILVNNASAISLTGTLQTDMKRYDLMNSINARGTYLCSRVCLPFLLKSKNPHILNLSPPLNMSPLWFKGHVAYTMAKYGMSMCVLGMAEEFRDQGVAVNALWPRTVVHTASMEMIGGGESIKSQCRTTDVMGDAAYLILTSNSRQCSGNFFIDEELLRSKGIEDMEQYSIVKGAELMLDFFLPEIDIVEQKKQHSSLQGYGSEVSAASQVAFLFQKIQSKLSESLVNQVGASYQFDLSGNEEGSWHLDLRTGAGVTGKGTLQDADCTLSATSDVFTEVFHGKADLDSAFSSGSIVIKGDKGAALKLALLIQQIKA